MSGGSRKRDCFTLIELLMVVVIIMLALSMLMSYNGKRDQRSLFVHAEAEQLASVLRKTRGMAMDQKSTFGVAFNITNAPGSSGKILNNRAGGHYYRIIGPEQHNGPAGLEREPAMATAVPYPDHSGCLREPSNQHDWPMNWSLGETAYDWVSPPYVLPKNQVRFLALTDEDNGNLIDCNWGFWTDLSAPRLVRGSGTRSNGYLNAWGGYDPTILDFDKLQNLSGDPYEWQARSGASGTISYTGFYYEGNDGHLTGCLNTQDRYIYQDTGGMSGIDGTLNASGTTVINDAKTFLLFKGGQPRPLINADWLDCVIMFRPDGSAYFLDWITIGTNSQVLPRSGPAHLVPFQ